MCPATMARQMSTGSNVPMRWKRRHRPSGTSTCETIEMYSGLRVSPVPWSAPV